MLQFKITGGVFAEKSANILNFGEIYVISQTDVKLRIVQISKWKQINRIIDCVVYHEYDVNEMKSSNTRRYSQHD